MWSLGARAEDSQEEAEATDVASELRDDGPRHLTGDELRELRAQLRLPSRVHGTSGATAAEGSVRGSRPWVGVVRDTVSLQVFLSFCGLITNGT